MQLSQSEVRYLEKPFNYVFVKLFNTFDKYVIKSCQYYMHYLPLELVICYRTVVFLSKVKESDNIVLNSLFNWFSKNTLWSITERFHLNIGVPESWKRAIWTYFSNMLTA